jgi:nucleotide-binding universal stress UspA family protein
VMQPAGDYAGPQAVDALGWEISRQEALKYLERTELEVSQSLGRSVDVRLEQGCAANRIADVAEELGADLIVIGRGGGGLAPHRSLGSTAQHVLALARRSVFVAHSPSAAAFRQCVLVPLDGSLRAESVLPVASKLVRAHGAEMLLIHVVREPLPTALLSAAEDMKLARTLAGTLEANAQRYLERLRRQVQQADGTTAVRTLVVRHPNECQCLLDIADRERGILLVVSAHGAACESAQPVGSVTAYLVAHSGSPLLVLQDVSARERHGVQEGRGRLAPALLQASTADGP